MGSFFFVLYCVFTGLALVLGALVALQTWEHRRFARSRLKHLGVYPEKGPAVIVAPCRGLDEGVEENLRTLFFQDYEDYEIRFVVEDEDDPIYPIIRRLMAAHRRVQSRLIVAGRATTCGQKVHNLRAATADLPERVEYLAFVDSDARLRRQWLRGLVSRLDDPNVGASTGYRWFVPARGTLANHLLYSVNTNVAMFFGCHSPTVVWGGSWAIRRDMFESLGLRGAWRGTLSDDLVVSRLLRRAGLRVLFEPACMVTSPLDTTLGQMLSFVRRQYLMGRFYLPRWWALALLLTTLITLPMVANLGVLAWFLATGSPWAWLAAGAGGALYGWGAGRAVSPGPGPRLLSPASWRASRGEAFRGLGRAPGERGQLDRAVCLDVRTANHLAGHWLPPGRRWPGGRHVASGARSPAARNPARRGTVFRGSRRADPSSSPLGLGQSRVGAANRQHCFACETPPRRFHCPAHHPGPDYALRFAEFSVLT